MAVVRLDPDVVAHVDEFRRIRLRALRTDPAAFGSDHAREAAFDDALWRSRLAGFAGHRGTVFGIDATARPGDLIGPLAGIVGVGLPEPDDATIWGMWVAPEGRRRGLAGRLLDAAERWAVDAGVPTATLWVHRTNAAAQAVYRGRGYELVGPDALPAHVPPACNDEICMRLRLTPARSDRGQSGSDTD